MWQLYKKGGLPPAIQAMFDRQSAQQMAFIRHQLKRQRHDDSWDTPLKELEVAVFDLETTGFRADAGDEILSFGAVIVSGGELKDRFYTLVNPGRNIPPEIQEMTGITEEMTKEAPGVMEALRMFFEFVDRRTLVAHASGHDKRFLNAALWRTSKIRMPHRVLDTMMIAKWLEPNRSDYTLDALLGDQGIPVTIRHHALEDSIMTAKLWLHFTEMIVQKRHVHTLGDLYSYLSRS